MKLIITVTTDIDFDQRVCKIADSLVKAGHTVCVIGRKKSDLVDRPHPFQKIWFTCWFNRSFLFYAEFNIRLFVFLLFQKYDAVYACDLDTLLGAGLITKFKNKKLFFDAHEYMQESVELRKKKWIPKIWAFIGRFMIPKTDQRFTVSESLATELSQKYKLPFLVVRNVPYRSKINKVNASSKIIWYQGAINEGRGLEQVIEYLEDLPDYEFHLAGTGDLLEQLINQAKQKSYANRIRFYGRLAYDEMMHKAQAAFVGIDLLVSDSKSYWYSLSNKTFDYIQAGLPSIQMNFPEYKKIHDQYRAGLLINHLSKNEFIAAIHQMESFEYYSLCKSNCLLAAEELIWEEESLLLLNSI